jgi:hypothetical protein
MPLVICRSAGGGGGDGGVHLHICRRSTILVRTD